MNATWFGLMQLLSYAFKDAFLIVQALFGNTKAWSYYTVTDANQIKTLKFEERVKMRAAWDNCISKHE